MIELLVVISIIALLIALAMPSLSRARKQARAVVCQSNLKQWGLHFATLASENDGRLPEWEADFLSFTSNVRETGSWLYWGPMRAPDPMAESVTRKMRLCPAASKLSSDVFDAEDYDALGAELFIGGTSLAWGQWLARVPGANPLSEFPNYSSYGLNRWYWRTEPSKPFDRLAMENLWRTVHIRGAARVPFMLDSTYQGSGPGLANEFPPQQDAVPLATEECAMQHSCIDRHNGGVNAVFMDWSVRRVGLKELWTLQWHREFDTSGPWTKAGGVQPGDWPEWMRGFKDY